MEDRIKAFKDNLTKYVANLSRQTLKFKENEEVFKYLNQALAEQLDNDYFLIALKDTDQIEIEFSSGFDQAIEEAFPIPISHINENMLQTSIASDQKIAGELLNLPFKYEGIKSWVTFPILEGDNAMGFCVVGFNREVNLYHDLGETFDELGSYVAIALNIIRQFELNDKKIESLQLVMDYLFSKESGQNIISDIVDRIARETSSNYAAIYIFDKNSYELKLQQPAYGKQTLKLIYKVKDIDEVKGIFSDFEESGTNVASIPIIIDGNFIGLIYASKGESEKFSTDNIEILKANANYLAIILENFQLVRNEEEQSNRLKAIINLQNQLVQASLENEDFDKINQILALHFNSNIVLYNRFLNVMSHHIINADIYDISTFIVAGKYLKEDHKHQDYQELIIRGRVFKLFSIKSGQEHHGYLAIEGDRYVEDDLGLLTINVVKNIYALQFVKMKISKNTEETIKGSFIKKLFTEKIDEMDTVIEYGNIFNWDLYEPYRLAVVELKLQNEDDLTVIEKQTKISNVFEGLKQAIATFDDNIFFYIGTERLYLIKYAFNVPQKQQYWETISTVMKNYLSQGQEGIIFHIGVGGISNKPEDYYDNYQKAQIALNSIRNNNQSSFAFFEELGSSTVLNDVKDSPQTDLFMDKFLKPLHDYSINKQDDLFMTLEVYLRNNSNMSKTAEKLFVHRSTLAYRIERIKEITGLNLEDYETQFNLQLAYKLFNVRNSGETKL